MRMTLAEMRSDLSSWVPGFTPDAIDSSINRAYSELARMYPWSKFDTEFKLVTKQYVETGGAHFTNGIATISAADSVSASWSGDYAGMFLKKRSDVAAYYTITSNTSVELTVTEAYLGITTTAVSSAGDGYSIFQHIYAIPSGVETIVHLMQDSYLEEMDDITFETIDPDLESEGEPSKWRNAGVSSTGVTLVQLFPARIDDVYELRGRGRLRPERLISATYPLLDSTLIMSFAEVDLMQRKRMINPATISDDMLQNAMSKAGTHLSNAVNNDWRARTTGRYTHDNFFKSYHRGQKWYVSHDPIDAAF